MQKQLGMLTSFLFLCISAFVGAGCSDNLSCDTAPVSYQCCQPVDAQESAPGCQLAYQCAPAQPVCQPVRQQACQPVCQPVRQQACQPVCQPVRQQACQPVNPVCPPEPLCKVPTRCKHPNSNELKCMDHIIVTARNPRLCILGEQYPLDFDVKACDDVCDVVVSTHLPEGVTFIKSTPEAQVDGRKLTWHFGAMDKGECQTARVLLKCECEGELCACFCATATPVRFCALLCAKPLLTCEKIGPKEACPGDPVKYSITVTNRGSCAAEEVVLTDNIPPELEHESCLRTLIYKLGTLEPCQSKTVNICLTAVKRGTACNTAVVTACNADSVQCQACTCICCCAVDITKVGPKEQTIGRNADYQITVTNTGDKTLTDVVVVDSAPSSTSIVAAKGATINGNQAVWKLRELKPGDKVSFAITLYTCTPGCFTNKVGVDNCQGCRDCAEFTTRWRGRPALDYCIEQGGNPICVDERTSYTVKVTNQGQEADSNVVAVFRFPNEVLPLGTSGDAQGTVSGQTVTFAPIPNLRPHQTVTYRVDAQAKASGDARIVVEVSSDSIKTPISQQESTIVN